MPRTAPGPGQPAGRPQPRGADRPNPDPRQQGYYGSEQDYPSPPGYPSRADYQPQLDSRAPWEGGLPEPDPALRYREPGPGMPGYRGSRDARYGGDRR